MFENLDDPRKQALLAMAAGLLSPVRGKGFSGFGEALGQGIQGGLLGFNQAQRSQEAVKRGEMERRLEQARLDQIAQQKAAQDYMGQGIGKFLNPGTPSVPYNDSLGTGPQAPIPGQAPSFDQSGFASYLAQNPATAMQALQFMPKPQGPIKVGKTDRLIDPNTFKEVLGAEKPAPHWLDGGDKWIPVGPDGAPVGAPIPKSMAPGEAQRLGMDRARLGMEAGRYAYEVGNGQGIPKKLQDAVSADVGKQKALDTVKAQQELPQTEAEAKQTIGLVDKLVNHPGFSTVVGAKGPTGMPAAAGYPIPGTDAADFTVLRNQLVGKQFLQAFQTLKGGGQITEVEGRKATAAITRMDTAQSEEEFVSAAREFRDILAAGIEKAKAKGATTQQPKAPAGVDRGRLLFDARKAIQAGADPEAVRKRLSEMGISEGL